MDKDNAETVFGCLLVAIWGISVLLSLGFIGVVIWGIIELVQWVTA